MEEEKIRKKVEKIQLRYEPFITIVEKFEVCGKGLLTGYFVSVKDNICTQGIRTTAGSKILEGYVPPFDATCVKKVKEHGGILLGKTSMDEFGFGTFNVNCAYGIPKNPLDVSRSCGGSSGGAACLTQASDFPHVALAVSTGGSISCPAAFCGVVGLTPTYGRVSRWGLIDFANSLDKIGCMAKSVKEVALTLQVICGRDELDPTSVETKENFLKLDPEKRYKIGIPKEYFEQAEEEVAEEVWKAVKIFESEGFSYQEVSLPSTRYAIPAYYLLAVSEASTNLAKFCGMRYGFELELEGNYDEYFSEVRASCFGEEAKRRILLGTFARMAGFREAYYLKALQVRRIILQEFKKVFKKFDLLLAPTMPLIAPKFEEIARLTPLQVYACDILTVAPNLAGIPMLSIPAGKVKGMPVGLHLLADHWQEKKILNAGYFFEKVR